MSCAKSMHVLWKFLGLEINRLLEEHREEREPCGKKVPNDFYWEFSGIKEMFVIKDELHEDELANLLLI